MSNVFMADINIENKIIRAGLASLNELNETNLSQDVKYEEVDNKETEYNYYDENNYDSLSDFEKIVDSFSLFKLKKKLLAYYDGNSRPVFNSSKPLMVKLGVSVAQINNLDVNFQVIFYFFI